MNVREVLSKLVLVARWIGVVVFPIPVYSIVVLCSVPLLNWGIIGRAEWVSNLLGQNGLNIISILANVLGGIALAHTAALLAPSGKFVAAVAMSSFCGFGVLLTLIGNIQCGNGWFIATNIATFAGMVGGCASIYMKYSSRTVSE